MNPKSFVIAIVTLILVIPLGLGVFNHYIGSRLLALPHGILGKDFPLKSRMYLSENFKGYSYSFNIHNGFEKITFTTNALGFRVPLVDFSKEMILMSGDSILFGINLNDWETVPYLLQKNADFNSKFSFFNAGIPGKSVAHHLLTLRNFIEHSKNQNFRIKYLMMWVSFNDFEENISLQTIETRALKQELSMKDRLAVSFPSMAVFYKSLRDRSIGGPARSFLNSIFTQDKHYRYERIPKNEPEQTRRFLSDSKVVEKNLNHFRDLIDLCDTHGITLINVITAYGYNDIFYKKGFSDYMDETLRSLGQKHVIKLKDLYLSHPDIYPYISKRGHDFHHFSYRTAQLIAEEIGNYLSKLEGN